MYSFYSLHVHLDLRPILAKAKSTPEFREIIQKVKDACTVRICFITLPIKK